jgi:hypothetical protein
MSVRVLILLCRLHILTYVTILAAIKEKLVRRLPTELTGWYVAWYPDLPEERKYDKDIGELSLCYSCPAMV